MLEAALDALQQIFTRPFRVVLVKTLAATLLLLAVVWVGLEKLAVAAAAHMPYPWLASTLSIASGLGLVVGLAFAISPLSFVVAGFFFDELADVVEHEQDPNGPRGRALPLAEALWIGIKFGTVAVGVMLVAALLLLVPIVNAVAFFVANAYVFGRGYFELAALRYRPLAEVRHLRRAHFGEIFVAGLFIASFLSIPILNLLTPLFATAFMVRVHKGIMRREMAVAPPQPTRWRANWPARRNR